MRRVVGSPQDERIPDTLFDDGTIVSEVRPADVSLSDIDPAEQALVAHAVEQRQREFAAGRLCARRALARLGVASTSLLADAAGAPQWPPNIVGSISHVKDKCGVAVASRETFAGLGFDIEPALELARDTWRIVLTENEQAAIGAFPEAERGVIGRLLFSAKESFYKCYRSAGGGWLDFDDVELSPTPMSDTIAVCLRKPLATAVVGFEGRFAITPRFIFTAFTAR